MSTRLVVGCGSVGRQLADRLAARPGEVFVVSDSDQRVSAVRDRGIDAATVSFENAASIQGVVDDVSSVIIGGDLPARNLALARLAAEAYPEQFCLAYCGDDATADDRAALGALVDRVVDTGTAVNESLEPSIGPAGRPTRRLQRRLRSLEGPLAIVTHDNPDPDAIGSAIALRRLAERAGLEAEACYYGRISHQENLAFVNLLGYELRKLRPDTDLSAFGSIALVDHARPGVNDGLPPETPVDMVLDHHPPREPIDTPYADLRTDVGATSTLLTDHLRRLETDPPEVLATGLLFGIRVDTDDFTRGVSWSDLDAASYLYPFSDLEKLQTVERQAVSTQTLDTIGQAIDGAVVRGQTLATFVGEGVERDALAQAADRLLTMDGVTTTFVFGYVGDTVYGSARTCDGDIDIGETLRDAFDQVGSAGGHANMAGAQLPIGMLVESDDEETEAIIREAVSARFFEAFDTRPLPRPAGAFEDERFLSIEDLAERPARRDHHRDGP